MPKPGKFKDVLKYGQYWNGDTHPAQWELYAISQLGHWEKNGRKCGMGLPYHVKQFMKMAWPNMQWHRWSHNIIDEFLREPGRCGIFGPSSSSKSFTVARCVLTMFYARPHGTTALISSTTIESLKRRIWDYVVSSHKEAREDMPWLPGHMIESKLMLLADASAEEGRSFKDGIVGVAIKKGGQWKGLEEYVGAKNDVFILACDELQFCPVGVIDALANLESNKPCYFAGMGNLPDVNNPLGKICEPKMGWEALPDVEKTRVYETVWSGGRALQLIGMDSPNLDYPEGEEPFPKLIGRRYIEQCRQNYGAESDKFHMFASGKVPKACMNRTVITKAMCIKFNATEDVKWGHQEYVRGYGLDAAYSGVGGDRTVGAPFIFGRDVTGKWRFWLGPLKVYSGSTTEKLSHCESIALDCKHECEAHGIPPEHVFFDGTGRSELMAAFAINWSVKVNPIEFGGPATERPAFTGEKHLDGEQAGETKTCREVFDRFVTELCFALRQCVMSDQMRGLKDEVIEESSQRRWAYVRGAKYSVEPKEGSKDGEIVGMKARGLRSPDLMDCAITALEGARRLGFPLGKLESPEKKAAYPWFDVMREQEWDERKSEELVA